MLMKRPQRPRKSRRGPSPSFGSAVGHAGLGAKIPAAPKTLAGPIEALDSRHTPGAFDSEGGVAESRKAGMSRLFGGEAGERNHLHGAVGMSDFDLGGYRGKDH